MYFVWMDLTKKDDVEKRLGKFAKKSMRYFTIINIVRVDDENVEY